MLSNGEALSKDILGNGLIMSEVKSIVSKVTPLVPYLGISSLRLTSAHHVFSHLSKTVNDAGAKGPYKPEDADHQLPSRRTKPTVCHK